MSPRWVARGAGPAHVVNWVRARPLSCPSPEQGSNAARVPAACCHVKRDLPVLRAKHIQKGASSQGREILLKACSFGGLRTHQVLQIGGRSRGQQRLDDFDGAAGGSGVQGSVGELGGKGGERGGWD